MSKIQPNKNQRTPKSNNTKKPHEKTTRKELLQDFKEAFDQAKTEGYDFRETCAVIEGRFMTNEYSEILKPLYKLWLERVATNEVLIDANSLLVAIADLKTFEGAVAIDLNGTRQIGIAKIDIIKLIKQLVKES